MYPKNNEAFLLLATMLFTSSILFLCQGCMSAFGSGPTIAGPQETVELTGQEYRVTPVFQFPASKPMEAGRYEVDYRYDKNSNRGKVSIDRTDLLFKNKDIYQYVTPEYDLVKWNDQGKLLKYQGTWPDHDKLYFRSNLRRALRHAAGKTIKTGYTEKFGVKLCGQKILITETFHGLVTVGDLNTYMYFHYFGLKGWVRFEAVRFININNYTSFMSHINFTYHQHIGEIAESMIVR